MWKLQFFVTQGLSGLVTFQIKVTYAECKGGVDKIEQRIWIFGQRGKIEN
jgi:hypothetical protein